MGARGTGPALAFVFSGRGRDAGVNGTFRRICAGEAVGDIGAGS